MADSKSYVEAISLIEKFNERDLAIQKLNIKSNQDLKKLSNKNHNDNIKQLSTDTENERDLVTSTVDMIDGLGLSSAQKSKAIYDMSKDFKTPGGADYGNHISKIFMDVDTNQNALAREVNDLVLGEVMGADGQRVSLSDDEVLDNIQAINNNPNIDKGSTWYKNNIKPIIDNKTKKISASEAKKTLSLALQSMPLERAVKNSFGLQLDAATNYTEMNAVMNKAWTVFNSMYSDDVDAKEAFYSSFMSGDMLGQIKKLQDIGDNTSDPEVQRFTTGAIKTLTNIIQSMDDEFSLGMRHNIVTGAVQIQKDSTGELTTKIQIGNMQGQALYADNIPINQYGYIIGDPTFAISSNQAKMIRQWFKSNPKAYQEFLNTLETQYGIKGPKDPTQSLSQK